MRYLSMVALVFLTACYGQHPLTRGPADNNGTYKVAYLFEQDGCKVYRFEDKGNWVYFTNCRGEVLKGDSASVQNTTHLVP